MRHNNKLNHLGRTSSERKSMLANMASSLIVHKRITTTVAKAKALRIYVEPLLSKSKEDTTHSRRTVFSYLQDKAAVSELFREVALKIADRPGGYTRILRTGTRLGDSAEMCIIELVDFNEVMLSGGAEEKKGRKRRARRGTGKKGAEVAEEPKAAKQKSSGKETKASPKPERENKKKKQESPVTEEVEQKPKPADEVISDETEPAVDDEAR